MVPEISITNFILAQKPAMYEIKTLTGNLDYLRRLSLILKSTPREVLHAYFQLNVIKTWVSRLPEEYSRPLEAFQEATGDKFHMAPVQRQEICIGEVRDSLGELLSAVFIERAFSPDAKILVDRIAGGIIEAYSTRLDSLEWMSAPTKTVAKKKRS
jgi:predicted metalloendopeptidase